MESFGHGKQVLPDTNCCQAAKITFLRNSGSDGAVVDIGSIHIVVGITVSSLTVRSLPANRSLSSYPKN